MINFIICDDNMFFLEKAVEIIGFVMIGNELAYATHRFSDYDNKFMKIIKQPLSNKVYILDIETPSNSGIDIARKIRETDLNSKIIFMTAFETKYGWEILKAELIIVNFISKMDDFVTLLKRSIVKTLELFSTDCYIRIDCSTYTVTLNENDILYIETSKERKQSIIHTINGKHSVSMPLNRILSTLKGDFVYSHRSCLVNKKNVVYVDKTNKIIHFKNGTTTDLLSYNYRNNV